MEEKDQKDQKDLKKEDEKRNVSPPKHEDSAGESKKKEKQPKSLRKLVENFQLPEGWKIETRERASGDRKGIVDRSYRDPNGKVTLSSLFNGL